MHHDPALASRHYLHPELLPVPGAVVDFVVGLALGQRLGSRVPIGPAPSGRRRLRVVP